MRLIRNGALVVSVFLMFALFSQGPHVGAINGCDGQAIPGANNDCFLNGKATGQKVGGAAPTASPTATPQDQTTGATTDGETCAVDKIGWILCPIIESAAKISDKTFDILADNFLRTDPQLFNDKSGTKVAWEMARNIANIMFIIAFLIIILSQVTGRGLTNYGIKKMLPRLIIAALAVNLSYYICQLAVDVTNIVGYEVQNALVGVSNSLGPSVFGSANGQSPYSTGGGLLTAIAVGALASAAVVWLILAPLGGIILFILITVITIILILLLRKALIVLLIVVSPIAFVLYLLPNTEKYFSKWMSMFGKLLMVFPVVGMLMGAGQLASTIIMVSGATSEAAISAAAKKCNPNNPESIKEYNDALKKHPGLYSNCGGDTVTVTGCGSLGYNVEDCGKEATVSWMLGLVAMGVAVAPLIGVWAVLKGALAAAGAIGGKISGAVSSATNGTAGWAGKNTAIGRGLAARKAIRQNYKDQRFANRMVQSGKRGALTRIAARGIGGNIGLGAEKLADALPESDLRRGLNAATGGFRAQNTKLSSNFAGAAEKIAEQEKNDQKALLIQAGLGGNADELAKKFDAAVRAGSTAAAKAAQEMLVEAGEDGGKKFVESVRRLEASGLGSSQSLIDVKRHIAGNQSSMKAKDADTYAWATDGQGRGIDNAAHREAFASLTDAQMGTQSLRALNKAIDDMDTSIAGSTGKSGMDDVRAARILANKDIAKDIKGKQLQNITDHSSGSPITYR